LFDLKSIKKLELNGSAYCNYVLTSSSQKKAQPIASVFPECIV